MKLSILAKIWYKKKLGLNVMIEIRNQIDFYLCGQKYRYFIVRFLLMVQDILFTYFILQLLTEHIKKKHLVIFSNSSSTKQQQNVKIYLSL
jgi:hypothetical protein